MMGTNNTSRLSGGSQITGYRRRTVVHAVSADRSARRRWRRRRIAFCLILAIAAAVPVVLWLKEPPRREPDFAKLVTATPGPVSQFELRDATGTLHTSRDWSDKQAVVLVFLGTDCAISQSYFPELTRLAGLYGSRGILFYGINSDQDVTADTLASAVHSRGLTIPTLLDPEQRIARQSGARVTPEAVLLAPDGQVLYHGRIDDRYSAGGQRERPCRTPFAGRRHQSSPQR